jgi:hypothetical protein
MGTSSGLAGVTLLLIILLVVLFILWMLLPFLIMGTNNRLEKILGALRQQNNQQQELIDLLKQKQNGP